jgi:hypothetical protein
MNTATNAEQVKLDLSKQADDSSVARVRTEIGGDVGDSWVTREVSCFAHADTDEQTLWLNVSQHTYASVGTHEPITTNAELVAHRFTREQAEALLQVLQHELAKF